MKWPGVLVWILAVVFLFTVTGFCRGFFRAFEFSAGAGIKIGRLSSPGRRAKTKTFAGADARGGGEPFQGGVGEWGVF